MNSFYSREELEKIGFKFLGEDVLLSRKASIYSSRDISIGSHVRIDDFCILSGCIEIGCYVHISAYSGLFGGEAGIEVKDYATISSRNAIYALTDDYSGEFMTNPTIEEKYRNVKQERVIIGEYAIIGSGCTILPGVSVGEGAAVGAMSLVTKTLESWTMNKGIPCCGYKQRSKHLLQLRQEQEKRV